MQGLMAVRKTNIVNICEYWQWGIGGFYQWVLPIHGWSLEFKVPIRFVSPWEAKPREERGGGALLPQGLKTRIYR